MAEPHRPGDPPATIIATAITGGLGLQPIYLLASKDWALSAILIVIVWKYFGFYMMLLSRASRASTSRCSKRRKWTARARCNASATSPCPLLGR